MRRPVVWALLAALAAGAVWHTRGSGGVLDLVQGETLPLAAYSAAPGRPSVPPPHEPGRVPVVDAGWVRRTAARAGLPETALTAYARAVLMGPEECGLGWTTLAAVGWVESHHGTLGGRVLRLDGTSSEPVIGPALDGRGDFAAIPATPLGRRLHGDARWERAVGPMQLLPDSWDAWESDGDGDAARRPFDLDDAALAAARYLCADGRDLATDSGWTDAVFSYNHSREYVAAVRAVARSYADGVAGR